MTRRHPLLPFLLAIAVTNLTLSLVSVDYGIPEWLESLLFSTNYIHLGFLGIWACHSVRGMGVRLGITIIAVCLYAVLEIYVTELELNHSNASHYCTVLILVTAVPFVFKSMQLILEFTIPKFRIIDLLSLTTSVCGLLGITQWVNQLPFESSPSQGEFVLGLMGTLIWIFTFFTCPMLLVSGLWLPKGRIPYGVKILMALFGIPITYGMSSVIAVFISGEYEPVAVLFLFWRLAPFTLTSVFWVLLWTYCLENQSRPYQRRKREQAALVKPEQPVRVPNQDVDPIDSSQPTEPDDKANDEPPGPIDLTV